MTSRRLPDILRHCKRLFLSSAATEWSDRRLLERFALHRDELAFASLIRRHGCLVLGVGRRILHQEQDAEDVFQATFLILARKAASGRWQESIAGWLYRVAYRLAIRTRSKILRQRAVDRKRGTLLETKAMAGCDRSELHAVLDDELQRLSSEYRQPLLLCYLEAKTRDQAAQQLGWSRRTLERRLEQGLKLLRVRLCRRGVELPTALLIAGLSQQAASANVSAAIVATTVEVAVLGSGVATVGSAISAQVAALAQGGLKAMAMNRLIVGAIVLFAVAVGAVGVGLTGQRLLVTSVAKEDRAVRVRMANPPAPDTWPEGTTVTGRVIDHAGTAVANAEVLLLGDERIVIDGGQRTWSLHHTTKDRSMPPSTRTNAAGEFRIERTKGSANRLAVIAADPLFWMVARKTLARGDGVEIKLPPAGSLAIGCVLPGKADQQEVVVELRTFDSTDWDTDVLHFHNPTLLVPNPGEKVIDHLPPGQYAVERLQKTLIAKNRGLLLQTDRQLVKIQPNQRTTVGFDRKAGRPLVGQIRGLEKIDLRYAHVTITYWGPEERFDPNYGQHVRQMTGFDVLPIQSDGRFTTDPIPPRTYHLSLHAVRSSTHEQSSQRSDFEGRLEFTVPQTGDMPTIEVVATPLAPLR
jgi:RNA polymerase sigma factor (sigma-70 family)